MCECGSRYSLCSRCVQVRGYVLPPDWLRRISELPSFTGKETRETRQYKMIQHRESVKRVIRLYDQFRRMRSGKGEVR